jgi:hypothetical protein
MSSSSAGVPIEPVNIMERLRNDEPPFATFRDALQSSAFLVWSAQVHVQESVRFFHAVDAFRERAGNGDARARDVCEWLLRAFVVTSAAEQVNLSDAVRRDTERRVEVALLRSDGVVPATLFDDAQEQVFETMRGDLWLRFMDSALYCNAVVSGRSLSPPPPAAPLKAPGSASFFQRLFGGALRHADKETTVRKNRRRSVIILDEFLAAKNKAQPRAAPFKPPSPPRAVRSPPLSPALSPALSPRVPPRIASPGAAPVSPHVPRVPRVASPVLSPASPKTLVRTVVRDDAPPPALPPSSAKPPLPAGVKGAQASSSPAVAPQHRVDATKRRAVKMSRGFDLSTNFDDLELDAVKVVAIARETAPAAASSSTMDLGALISVVRDRSRAGSAATLTQANLTALVGQMRRDRVNTAPSVPPTVPVMGNEDDNDDDDDGDGDEDDDEDDDEVDEDEDEDEDEDDDVLPSVPVPEKRPPPVPKAPPPVPSSAVPRKSADGDSGTADSDTESPMASAGALPPLPADASELVEVGAAALDEATVRGPRQTTDYDVVAPKPRVQKHLALDDMALRSTEYEDDDDTSLSSVNFERQSQSPALTDSSLSSVNFERQSPAPKRPQLRRTSKGNKLLAVRGGSAFVKAMSPPPPHPPAAADPSVDKMLAKLEKQIDEMSCTIAALEAQANQDALSDAMQRLVRTSKVELDVLVRSRALILNRRNGVPNAAPHGSGFRTRRRLLDDRAGARGSRDDLALRLGSTAVSSELSE